MYPRRSAAHLTILPLMLVLAIFAGCRGDQGANGNADVNDQVPDVVAEDPQDGVELAADPNRPNDPPEPRFIKGLVVSADSCAQDNLKSRPPVEGVTLELGGQFPVSQISASDGTFAFGSLPIGTYDISVSEMPPTFLSADNLVFTFGSMNTIALEPLEPVEPDPVDGLMVNENRSHYVYWCLAGPQQ